MSTLPVEGLAICCGIGLVILVLTLFDPRLWVLTIPGMVFGIWLGDKLGRRR